MDTDIRWIPDHRVEPSGLDDLGKLGIPVERVDPVALFLVDQVELLPFVEVGADERVAALDVVSEIGQGALVEHPEGLAERLFALPFEDLEQ